VSAETEGYTLGVEEEYQIVDAGTRELASRGERVLRRTQQSLGERVAPEMFASQVEAMTRLCRTLAEVRAELLRLRRAVIEAAAEEDARIAAASTHHFSHWQEQPITPKERYRRLAEREQQLAEEQVVFGFHVHVGLSDREVAVQVLNRARAWLAPMLALSANSPFWLGEDTGYASYRTQVWGRLPVSGPPAPFSSLAEHDALIRTLVTTGGALDVASVYWDIRLPGEGPDHRV
jgi:glutamate---cysteine ligase / carboxylate-amine ligase